MNETPKEIPLTWYDPSTGERTVIGIAKLGEDGMFTAVVTDNFFAEKLNKAFRFELTAASMDPEKVSPFRYSDEVKKYIDAHGISSLEIATMPPADYRRIMDEIHAEKIQKDPSAPSFSVSDKKFREEGALIRNQIRGANPGIADIFGADENFVVKFDPGKFGVKALERDAMYDDEFSTSSSLGNLEMQQRIHREKTAEWESRLQDTQGETPPEIPAED